MSDVSALFTSARIGAHDIPNRIVMAPMTRVRADVEGRVSASTAEYYAQRASGGLLITEATQVLPNGKGGRGTPGIHSDEQVVAWRAVTDRVHSAGGRIFAQLWHTGRAAHPSFLPAGDEVVSASAIAIEGDVFTPAGRVPYAIPRALTLDEIPTYVQAYASAARNAIAARYALERGAWVEAAALQIQPTQFPFADAVTHFARALGAHARRGRQTRRHRHGRRGASGGGHLRA